MDICRVCIKREMVMSHLFEASSEDIIKKIEFCTGILFTRLDNLPSKICSKCLEELHTAHTFKIKCLNSEQIYQDLAVVKVKDETDAHEDNVICKDINLNEGAIIITSNRPLVIKNDENIEDGAIWGDDKDVLNEVGGEFDFDVNVKVENSALTNTRMKMTKKVRLKKTKRKSVSIEDNVTKKPVKVVKKRGPYKKPGKPKTLAKLKFRKLFCETCNMKFKSKKESDDHKKEFHNEEPWICEICGKSFVHRSSHHSHMRVHYPPQHACEHCDYKTANKHDLNKHLWIHFGKKSYICPICAAAYRTSSNLHAHVRLTHERLRKYACTLCARSFYDRTKLNRHIDSHNDVKRYSCEVCHSCFTRRCYWKKHLQKQHDIVIPNCRPGRPKGGVVTVPDEKDLSK